MAINFVMRASPHLKLGLSYQENSIVVGNLTMIDMHLSYGRFSAFSRPKYGGPTNVDERFPDFGLERKNDGRVSKSRLEYPSHRKIAVI